MGNVSALFWICGGGFCCCDSGGCGGFSRVLGIRSRLSNIYWALKVQGGGCLYGKNWSTHVCTLGSRIIVLLYSRRFYPF